jgi:hypothetical protein
MSLLWSIKSTDPEEVPVQYQSPRSYFLCGNKVLLTMPLEECKHIPLQYMTVVQSCTEVLFRGVQAHAVAQCSTLVP